MTQQDLFSTPLTSSAQEDIAPGASALDPASVALPDGFYEQVLRRVAAHDLPGAMVAYARELVGMQAGLTAFEQGALTLLVLATIIEQRRGSTRLPVGAIRAVSARHPASDLQGDGGSSQAAEDGESARLLEILGSLLASKNGDDLAHSASMADFLGCLAAMLNQGVAAELIGRPGDYRPLILDGDYLYQQRMLFFEDRLLLALRTRLNLADFDLDRHAVQHALSATLAAMGGTGVGGAAMALNHEQQYALLSAVFRPFTVISGGPGTGKTSIVVSVLRLLARLGVEPGDVALAAPTGKAAHRLGDAVHGHLQALQPIEDDVDARLLRELAGASTLHRLLGYSPGRNDYYYHENNRLPQRVVIVDEASMIDLFLMERLLSAVEPTARLILLGDADQLPSVDAGAVFRDLVPARVQQRSEWLDLVEAKVAPEPVKGVHTLASRQPGEAMARHAVRLQTSYRMDPRSPAGAEILRAAQALNRGDYAALCQDDSPGLKVRETFEALQGAGVEICEPSQDAAGLDTQLINGFVQWWYAQRVANLEGFRALILGSFELDGQGFAADALGGLRTLFEHFSRFQALTITRVFATGSEQLNAALHARHLRFLGTQAAYWSAGEFAVGEPIIMLKNDYARGLFNGDQGIILIVQRPQNGLRIAKPMAVFLSDGEFVAFEVADLGNDIEHGFALTIHKAQGSEYDSVAIVLPEESLPLLSREILYTGMTRSRRSVLLVGDRKQVEAAAKNAARRFSGIAEKLGAR